MQKKLLKSMVLERMGKPLDARLWDNKDYMESWGRYHKLLELLKEELGSSQGGDQLVLTLDDVVGEYSGYYGETAYILGFHDGVEFGLEHGKQCEKESDIGEKNR